MHFTWFKFVLRAIIVVTLLPLFVLFSLYSGYKGHMNARETGEPLPIIQGVREAFSTLASLTVLYILAGFKISKGVRDKGLTSKE